MDDPVSRSDYDLVVREFQEQLGNARSELDNALSELQRVAGIRDHFRERFNTVANQLKACEDSKRGALRRAEALEIELQAIKRNT